MLRAMTLIPALGSVDVEVWTLEGSKPVLTIRAFIRSIEVAVDNLDVGSVKFETISF